MRKGLWGRVCCVLPSHIDFGGKRAVASEVWDRLGDARNYVEPFCGSAAVLLARPDPPLRPGEGTESIGDIDGHITNVLRALKHDPDKVAWHLMDPPNGIDMAARREHVNKGQPNLIHRMLFEADYYDAELAGYWIYLQCCFMVANKQDKGPCTPRMWRNGMGVVAYRDDEKLLADLRALSERLRHVRIAYGDWKRLITFSALQSHGLSAIVLDPPYGVEDRHELYAHDSRDVSHEVFEWAIENQDDSLLRIAVCGYEGEHDFPDTWEVFEWESHGFVGKKGSQGRANRKRERIWFSPNCLRPEMPQRALFEV